MWLHICDLAELHGRVPLSRVNTKVTSVYSTGDLPGRKGGWASIRRVCGRCQRLFDAIGFHQRRLLALEPQQVLLLGLVSDGPVLGRTEWSRISHDEIGFPIRRLWAFCKWCFVPPVSNDREKRTAASTNVDSRFMFEIY
jgi:hypothetical protein